MTTTILAIIAGVITLAGTYLTWRMTRDPRKRYEAKQAEIVTTIAEIDRLMAVGGNANAYAAKRLRAGLVGLYADLDQLKEELGK